MTSNIITLNQLGDTLNEQRKLAGMSISALASKAGKVREVIYRLENGDDVTVSSLLSVLSALGLSLHLGPAIFPSMEEVARQFARDED